MLQDTEAAASTASAHAAATDVKPTQRLWKAANADTEHVDGWDRSPDLGVGWKRISDASAVTEVHLRRLDSTDTLHRRVVAVLTVDATPEEVTLRCPGVCCAVVLCAVLW